MRTRNSSIIALACLGLFGAGFARVGSPMERAAVAGVPAPATVVSSFTGTWLGDPAPRPRWATQGFQVLMNIHDDGTLLWSHNFEYGSKGMREDSAVYGSWTQTGPLEITSRELGFLYNPAGIHQATGRVTTVYTFSPDFKTFSALAFEEVFGLNQDPTDPSAVPMQSFNFAFTAKRLNAPS